MSAMPQLEKDKLLALGAIAAVANSAIAELETFYQDGQVVSGEAWDGGTKTFSLKLSTARSVVYDSIVTMDGETVLCSQTSLEEEATGPTVVISGDYNLMIVELDGYRLSGIPDVIGQLHTGGVQGATSLILSVQWNEATSSYELIGEARLERVTDSKFAVVASGSGSTRTMVPGHNLALSGVGTCYDTSAGAHLATAVVWTRVGDVVTFTAGDPSATFGAGDVLMTEGLCELGELLSVAAGGLWVPTNMLMFWASGLRTQATSAVGFSRLRLATGPTANTPGMLLIHAVVDTGTIDGAAGAYWGLGTYSPSSGKLGCSVISNDAGTWERGYAFGLPSALGVTTVSAIGTPGSKTGVEFTWSTSDALATKMAYHAQVNKGALTAGASLAATGTTAATFGQGADGPPGEIGIAAYAGASGGVDMTIKRLRWNYT